MSRSNLQWHQQANETAVTIQDKSSTVPGFGEMYLIHRNDCVLLRYGLDLDQFSSAIHFPRAQFQGVNAIESSDRVSGFSTELKHHGLVWDVYMRLGRLVDNALRVAAEFYFLDAKVLTGRKLGKY